MLIVNAEIAGRPSMGVRIEMGRIASLGELVPLPGEQVIDAEGGALLPGLHDHHIHLFALAAARQSVACGPPEVTDAAALAARLAGPGSGWLRGTGYHESVAGLLDAAVLDAWAPHRPVRIQHRGGRMWFLNSLALDHLLDRAPPPPGLEREGGRWTGRLFDEDAWLRGALGTAPPDLSDVGRSLAAFGITGVTDMSPANDAGTAALFAAAQASGVLPQRLLLGGALSLRQVASSDRLRVGAVKLHLHEAALPAMDEAIATARKAHEDGRVVAVHCVTEVELLFALAVLREAGVRMGDRIEHASVAPDYLADDLAQLGVQVVTQAAFVRARGDRYRADVDAADWPNLYRLRGWLARGVVLAGGSDAPFGPADPWEAMAAAVDRQTAAGKLLGPDETLTPEQALALYLADPVDLARQRQVMVGAVADLCLLDRGWAAARQRLHPRLVRMTMVAGSIVFNRVDEAPVERGFSAQAFA